MQSHGALLEYFEASRPHLRSVAFRLLGTIEDAEDAVQSAWIKASQSATDEVENPVAWLTTLTARVSLDRLRARARRAEIPWDGREFSFATAPAVEDDVLLADDVDRALVVLLDRLSPAERVAYVLHDLFAVPFEQVSQVLDRSRDSAKKLASRARQRLHDPPPVDPPERLADHARITRAFLAASRDGDLATLLDLLAPDVTRRVDPGLVDPETALILRGATRVAQETRRFAARARAGAVVLVDGAPGIVIAPFGRPQAVIALVIESDQRIHAIDIIAGTGPAALSLIEPYPL